LTASESPNPIFSLNIGIPSSLVLTALLMLALDSSVRCFSHQD
jgi:hypothetical protein